MERVWALPMRSETSAVTPIQLSNYYGTTTPAGKWAGGGKCSCRRTTIGQPSHGRSSRSSNEGTDSTLNNRRYGVPRHTVSSSHDLTPAERGWGQGFVARRL